MMLRGSFPILWMDDISGEELGTSWPCFGLVQSLMFVVVFLVKWRWVDGGDVLCVVAHHLTEVV
jgi:hypothetical protein